MFRKHREVPSSAEDRKPRIVPVDATKALDDEVARLTTELDSVASELAVVRRSLAEAEEQRRAAMRGVVTEISAVVEAMETEFQRALEAVARDTGVGAESGEVHQPRVATDGD